MERHNLYVFRCDNKLTQAEFAEKCGVSRVTYGLIESGKRGGSAKFWRTLQSAFGVPDDQMWKLQKTEERE